MTTKEAIEVLRGMIINDKNIPKAAMSQKNKNIALRTAIKALEAQDAMMLRVDIQETSAEDVFKMLKEMNNQPMLVSKSNNSEIPNGSGKDTNVHSNDTISRQAAIDALYSVDEYNARSVKAIRDLPTAQPDSESGYWIVKEGETAFWDVCSKCGEKTIHRMPHFKYCPYCRRRMEI